MHTTDFDLTPAERPRQIAAILANGLLRLRTQSQQLPEQAEAASETTLKESSDVANK